MFTTMMLHLVGAMPLKAWSADGPTLYALTIVGAGDSPKAATLAGPAVDVEGLAGWPSAARRAAIEVFAGAPPRRAHAVTVIAVLQVGNTSNCALFNLPGKSSRRSRPRRPKRLH